MFPIWRDDSKSPATIKHLLDIFIQAIGYLNPGQTSVIGFEAVVLEGSVIVNMTMPKKNQTFKEYCSENVFPQVRKYTREYDGERIDVVFDTYKAANLKVSARLKRGKGCRRKVQGNSITQTNWRAFLRIDQNKSELFPFISQELQGSTDDNDTFSVHL